MKKRLLGLSLALLGVVVLVSPAPALRIAFFPPAQRAIHAEVIVIGKVVGIEKQPVDLAPAPGAPEKVSHKIALVKIQENLSGAENLTHLKIAFVPPAAPPPPSDVDVPVRPVRPVRPPIRPGRRPHGSQRTLPRATRAMSARVMPMSASSASLSCSSSSIVRAIRRRSVRRSRITGGPARSAAPPR